MSLRKRSGAHPSRRALPGRQSERELFAGALAEAISGSPRLVLFEGEQGSGRTSLLTEIADSPLLPRRRIRVAHFALRPEDPLDLIAHAARAVTSHARFARTGGRRRTMKGLRRIAGDWLGAVPGWGDLLGAVYETTQAVRRRRRKRMDAEEVEEEIEEVIAVARRRPVALIIDELDLADDAAVERLRKLLRAEVGTRLLVVGAFRTPAPGAPRPPIRNLIERIAPERVSHRRLGPLTAEDVDEWLKYRLPGAFPPVGLREQLLAASGGQPGPLEATLAALIAAGVLSESGGGWSLASAGDALLTEAAPGPLLDLSRLSDAAADAVTAASLFGDEFEGDRLAAVLGSDELALEDQLAVAARYGLIEVTGTVDRPGGDFATRYRFLSSSARAALQRSIPRERRLALRSALDRFHGGDPAPDAGTPVSGRRDADRTRA